MLHIKDYNFEIYTLNPDTKETGWDIRFVSVFTFDKEIAKDLLKTFYPNFDCIISFNYGGCELGNYEFDLYNEGVIFADRHSYMNNEIIKTYYR